MKRIYYSPLLLIFLVFIACESEHQNESRSENYEPEFKIVDSLAIDYLGNLLLSDISPNGENFALRDHNRNAYLITNTTGTILHQWEKDTESPEGHGRTIAGPFFFGNDQLLVIGTFGYFFYDFDGNILHNFKELEWPSGYEMVFAGLKKFHYTEINGQARLIGPNLGGRFLLNKTPEVVKNVFLLKPENNAPLVEPDFEVPQDGPFANVKMNPAFGYHIQYETESLNFTAFEYLKAQTPASLSVYENKLAVLYPKDPTVYIYSISENDFKLDQSIALSPKELYIDDPKNSAEMKSIKSSDGSMSVMIGGGFGDGFLISVHIHKNQMFTSYRSGVKKDLRVEPKLVIDKNGRMTIDSDGMPKEKTMFQLFENGKKVGKDVEKPNILTNLVAAKDEFLWFSKNIALMEEESDFVVFYKVLLK